MVKRDDVWLVALDPTLGSELRKTRPAVIVSPDVTNKHLNTVVVVPLTSSIHTFAFRQNLILTIAEPRQQLTRYEL